MRNISQIDILEITKTAKINYEVENQPYNISGNSKKMNVFTDQVTVKYLEAQQKKFNFEQSQTSKFQYDFEVDYRNLNRQLTKYYGTRFYRAPEVILLQNYNFQVDIWAIGCIFSELIQKLEDFNNEKIIPVPLFVSETCYPLSPLKNFMGQQARLSNKDHLKVIFDMIGAPKMEQLEFIKEQNTFFYAQNYIKDKNCYDQCQIKNMFQKIDRSAIDLLFHLLNFNPDQRIKVENIQDHIFFKGFTNKNDQFKSKQKKIELDFETDHLHLVKSELQLLFRREVMFYHQTKIFPAGLDSLLAKIERLNCQ